MNKILALFRRSRSSRPVSSVSIPTLIPGQSVRIGPHDWVVDSLMFQGGPFGPSLQVGLVSRDEFCLTRMTLTSS